MYGAVVQLGYLAQYSHQVFSDLIDEARSHEKRIKALSDRTKTLMQVVSSNSSSTPPSLTSASSEDDGARPVPINGLFTKASQPSAIKAR